MEDKNLGDHIDISKSQRMTHLVQAILLVFIIGAVFARYWRNESGAAVMTSRSITIGSSKAGASTTHSFSFTLAGGSSVGSLMFEYCANTPVFDLPCIAPTGLNAGGATLGSQSGETGFSINAPLSSSSKIVLSRASASATIAGASSYSFNSVINPTTAGQSYYVRISAYTSLDATGLPTDKGSVVFVIISGDLTIGAYVPPYVAFCVGQTVGANCSSATGFDLNMGTLSESSTATQTTQISGATNVFTGYTVYVLGYTLTAGTNVIPAMSSATSSVVGTSQFGLNARANTSPNVGQDPTGAGTLAPIGQYATPNLFKYVSGEAIAQTVGTSDFNTVTISYIANTAQSQPAGVYTTTLTYVATSTF